MQCEHHPLDHVHHLGHHRRVVGRGLVLLHVDDAVQGLAAEALVHSEAILGPIKANLLQFLSYRNGS